MGPCGRLLIGLAELGQEISPYLEDWAHLLALSSPEAEPARRHLADLARHAEGLRASERTMDDLFWSPHPAEAARLEVWLSSALTRGHVPAPGR